MSLFSISLVLYNRKNKNGSKCKQTGMNPQVTIKHVFGVLRVYLSGKFNVPILGKL